LPCAGAAALVLDHTVRDLLSTVYGPDREARVVHAIDDHIRDPASALVRAKNRTRPLTATFGSQIYEICQPEESVQIRNILSRDQATDDHCGRAASHNGRPDAIPHQPDDKHHDDKRAV
jgi:hypothetical protein